MFAENEFELSRRQGDGSSLRDHLKVGERVSRRRVERLHQSPPESLRYLWQWFQELCMARQYNEAGALPSTNQELVAWSSLRNIKLTPHELDVLRRLDFACVIASRG